MYIALSGRPGSGKTTLAKALEAKGYLLINFTDLLKELASKALGNVSVETIKREKEFYRAFLQEYATVIGFQTDSAFVHQALRRSGWDTFENCLDEIGTRDKCVFDNVRTPKQWEVLKGLGFVLVEINYVPLPLPAHPLEQGLMDEADWIVWSHITVESQIRTIETKVRPIWEQRIKSLSIAV